MPNWASNEYYLTGALNDVKLAKELLDRSFANDKDQQLSTLLNTLGGDSDDRSVDCRGWVNSYEVVLDGKALWISTTSAWRNHDAAIVMLCHRCRLQKYFMSEELGCGWWVTNDNERLYWNSDLIYLSAVEDGRDVLGRSYWDEAACLDAVKYLCPTFFGNSREAIESALKQWKSEGSGKRKVCFCQCEVI